MCQTPITVCFSRHASVSGFLCETERSHTIKASGEQAAHHFCDEKDRRQQQRQPKALFITTVRYSVRVSCTHVLSLCKAPSSNESGRKV
jgi:hypothetical protein